MVPCAEGESLIGNKKSICLVISQNRDPYKRDNFIPFCHVFHYMSALIILKNTLGLECFFLSTTKTREDDKHYLTRHSKYHIY